MWARSSRAAMSCAFSSALVLWPSLSPWPPETMKANRWCCGVMSCDEHKKLRASGKSVRAASSWVSSRVGVDDGVPGTQ